MFERFTGAARLAVVKAQEEARLLHHTAIGTEHLLLGLLRDGGRDAAAMLTSFVSLEGVRTHVEETVGRGDVPPVGDLPCTPQATRALEQAAREAEGLGHDHVGTGHLVLGLLCEEDDRGCQALVALGADLAAVREQAATLAAGEAPVSGLRSWGGPEPMAERVARSRARAHAERDPVREGDPGGWEVLARAGPAMFRALAVARRVAADALRAEIAPIDLVVGVLATQDPAVREALAEAGAHDPSPARLAPGYGGDATQVDGGDATQVDGGDATQVDGGDAVVSLSGEARRACSMAVRLVREDTNLAPVHLLLAALEVLGPQRAAAAARRLGAEDVALRPALLARTVTPPWS